MQPKQLALQATHATYERRATCNQQHRRATHDLTSHATTFDGPSRARCTLNTVRCMTNEAPAHDACNLQPATRNLHPALNDLYHECYDTFTPSARPNAHEPTSMIDERCTMYASCMHNAQRTVCAARASTQQAARSMQDEACSLQHAGRSRHLAACSM
jgi:hypothetical protein